jgi:bacillolysin
MRKLGFFALAIVAAGCSQSSQDASSEGVAKVLADPSVTPAQQRAFEQLKLETNLSWTWMQHETLKTPMHIEAPRSGRPLLGNGISAERATLSFVNQYRDLFKMQDADAELKLSKSNVDSLGMTHARFQQVTHGVPVLGAELYAHYDRAGRLTSIDANYISGIHDLDLEPKLSAKTALDLAIADVIANTKNIDAALLRPNEGKLVVYAQNGHPATLAYEYTVRAVYGHDPAIWVTTVDAKSGAIINRYNNLQTVEGSGTGVLGDAKKLQVTQSGAGYTMTDTSRGVSLQTFDAAGAEVGPSQGATAVTSTALTTWDTGTAGAGAAVDAHFYAGVVFDYYKNVHARNAIDNAGSAMLSTAHFGQAFDNAFWDGTGMSYGDGGQLFKPLSAGLDVCGHEFTHGVTQNESALTYQGQSGALNEAVSDIFGAFIEHSYAPDDTKNWLMGENIALEPGLERDFKAPANGQQPANMSEYVNTQQDSGGVHINSGIVNNTDYLLTIGGTNPSSSINVPYGIGWEKSEKLWYRANTQYFMSTTNFAQAAQGVMSAGKDIGLDENELNIVDCAWKATGVVQGACAAITRPTSATPATTTPGGAPTTPGSSPGTTTSSGGDGDTTAAGDTGDDGTDTTPKPKAKVSLGQSSSGCSVGAAGSTPANLGPFAGLLAAVLGLTLSRRRRR